MAFYQCFKTADRTTYCSSVKFRNHTEAASWVAACMANFQIMASQLLGTPFQSDNQPNRAVIWP